MNNFFLQEKADMFKQYKIMNLLRIFFFSTFFFTRLTSRCFLDKIIFKKKILFLQRLESIEKQGYVYM
jgi:hypothetical protein